jgi:hypothetical protein
MPSNSAFKPGSSDFTIECWYFGAAISGVNQYLWGDGDSSTNNGIIAVRITPTGNFAADYFTGPTTVINRVTTGTINANAWNHLCVSKTGTTLYLGINGVLETFVGPSSMQSPATIYPAIARLGNYNGGYSTGYISNFRYVVGSAIYTTNPYTVPKNNLTAISGTSLLTCQSNRFIDNSSNAFAITTSGSPSVVAFSPFAPTAAYTTAAVGGSGYFDGNLDYLSVADNAAFDFGSGAFTVEAWFYRTGGGDRISQTVYNQSALAAASNSALFFGAGNNGLSLYLSTGGSSWTNSIETGVAPALNAWSHVVWQRNGNTLEIYLNGALQTVVSGTAAFSGTIFNSSRDVEIGIQASTNGPLFGNLCNLRVVKGATVYTGNFTPPTGQLATSGSASAAAYPSTTNVNTSFASSACSLLLNFTNAGITDATAKNDLETVGNAQISTSVSKFGGGSIAFNASANTYLSQNPATTDLYAFGSGDFTIEGWLYLNSTTGIQTFYDGRPNGSSNAAVPTIYITSGSIRYYVSAVDRITGSTLSTGQWYHIAIARSGGSTRMFINGTQAGSTYTDSTVYLNSANRPFIGGDSNTPGSNLLNGYIDDFRITKGYARYTGNFTPPTAPFPKQ